MAATQRKTILIAGLGPTVSDTAKETLNFDAGPPGDTIKLVEAEVAKAREGGFDCSIFIVEPWDPAGTIEKLKAKLVEQHWDGFSIGFGMRALKENSEIFEDMVNLAVEVSPKTKFVFPLGRQDIWKAVRRTFAVEA